MLTWLRSLGRSRRSSRRRRGAFDAGPVAVEIGTIEVLEDRTMLTSFAVDRMDDAGDASIGDGAAQAQGGGVTLRSAIQEANANAGADVITLGAGVFTLSIGGIGENAAATGDLDVTDELTIIGAGAGQTIIDAQAIDRVFEVRSGATLNLEGVTIRGGDASSSGGGLLNFGTVLIVDSAFEGNNARFGGGVMNWSGTATIVETTFEDNTGQFGAGMYNFLGTVDLVGATFDGNLAIPDVNDSGGFGGGLYNGRNAVTTITDTLFSGNEADRSGGGIYNSNTSLGLTGLTISSTLFEWNQADFGAGVYNAGTLNVGASQFILNTAEFSGGGIYNWGDATVNDTLFEDNSAGFGGAIYNHGDLTLNRGDLDSNEAATSGGGIYTADHAELDVVDSLLHDNTGRFGGGIYVQAAGDAEVTNSTLSGNEADFGGGVYNRGFADLFHVTITGNSATSTGGGVRRAFGTLEVENSIIAGNTAPTGNDVAGFIASQGYNLFGDQVGGSGYHFTDLLNVDPLLGPLADNGGPTLTHALLSGSPAIDGGVAGFDAPAIDQRGASRDGSPDIGAVEFVTAVSGVKFHDLDGDGVQDPGEPGLAGWVIFVDENNNGVFDGSISPRTFVSDDVPRLIDQGGGNTFVTSEVLVDAPEATIVDVNVTLDITHTWNSDLDVFLVSPSGTRVELFTDVGGSSENFSGTTLDDDAQSSIVFGQGPFTGTFQPEGSLALLNGEDADGVWTLEVVDDFAFLDGGTLNSWSLTITVDSGERAAVTDENGVFQLNVDPGQHVIREVLPEAWQQTFPGGNSHVVNLAAGDFVDDLRFGNRLAPGIHGVKFHDVDGDGVRDEGEPALAGWTILVFNDQGELVAETVTQTDNPNTLFIDETGTYFVGGLPAGAYTVVEVLREGWRQTTPGLNLIVNGSFETGDFSGWTADVIPSGANPFRPWQVTGGGAGNGFGIDATQPRDGQFVAWNGFDGAGPLEFVLAQDVTIPAGAEAVLSWQDRVQWNFDDLGAPAGQPRTYEVEVRDVQSGALLATVFSLSTGRQTDNPTGDTGWQSHHVDLSAFAGSTVSLVFRESVPQSFTGPAQIEFDAVSLTVAGAHNVVLDGDNFVIADFGNQAFGTIHGVKFEDLDGDGVRDPGEPGIGGWQIFIDQNVNGLYDEGEPTTYTGEDGSFSFSVTAGVHTVAEVVRTGWAQTAPGEGDVLVLFDFENGAQGFTIEGNGFNVNQWHLSGGASALAGHSAGFSFYFGAGEGPQGGGQYANNAFGTLTSPVIDLSEASGALFLEFNHSLGIEDFYDDAIVNILVDGAPVDTIATNNLPLENLPSATQGFERVSLDVSRFAGQEIRVQFVVSSDFSVTDAGWFIDDVAILNSRRGTHTVAIAAGDEIVGVEFGNRFDGVQIIAPADGAISTTGVLSRNGERDLVDVTFTQGGFGAFRLDGLPGGLRDPFLRLESAFGTSLGEDDDGGPGLNSLALVPVAAGQTIRANVGAFADVGTGGWVLTVSSSDGQTPLPLAPAVNGPGFIGAAVGGVAAPREVQAFVLDIPDGVQPGALLTLEMTSLAAAAGSNGPVSPGMWVFNPNGTRLAANDFGFGLDSRIDLELTQSMINDGRLIVLAGGRGTNFGTFAVSAELLPAGFDDFGNTPADAQVIDVSTLFVGPITQQGRLERTGDEDWFQITLPSAFQDGDVLQIQQLSTDGRLDPYLYVYDATAAAALNLGDSLLAQNDDAFFSLDSEVLVHNLTAGQTIFVRADAFSSSAGGYELIIDVLRDDFPNDFAEAPPKQLIDFPVNGEIERAGDVDWFSFVANGSGPVIVTQEAAADNFVDTVLQVFEAVRDPGTGEIINANFIGFNDDHVNDGGVFTFNSRVTFEAIGGREYLVRNAAFGSSTGEYRTTIQQGVTIPGDVGGTFGGSQQLSTAAIGATQFEADVFNVAGQTTDVDMFEVRATVDGVMTITVNADVAFALQVFEDDDQTQPLRVGRDDAGTANVRTVEIPVHNGSRYFIRIEGAAPGDYDVNVTEAADASAGVTEHQQNIFDAAFALARQLFAEGRTPDEVLQAIAPLIQAFCDGPCVVGVLDPVDFILTDTSTGRSVGFTPQQGRVGETGLHSGDGVLELVVAPVGSGVFNLELQGVGAGFAGAVGLVNNGAVTGSRSFADAQGLLKSNLQLALDFTEATAPPDSTVLVNAELFGDLPGVQNTAVGSVGGVTQFVAAPSSAGGELIAIVATDAENFSLLREDGGSDFWRRIGDVLYRFRDQTTLAVETFFDGLRTELPWLGDADHDQNGDEADRERSNLRALLRSLLFRRLLGSPDALLFIDNFLNGLFPKFEAPADDAAPETVRAVEEHAADVASAATAGDRHENSDDGARLARAMRASRESADADLPEEAWKEFVDAVQQLQRFGPAADPVPAHSNTISLTGV